MAILTLRANGTIQPSRFVKIAADNSVDLITTANSEIFGVSHEGTRVFPMEGASGVPVAQVGESVAVYTVGEVCLVEAGGNINAGNLLESNNAGQAVAATLTGTTIRNVGAVALESGAAGQKIRCLVLPLQKFRPALS